MAATPCPALNIVCVSTQTEKNVLATGAVFPRCDKVQLSP